MAKKATTNEPAEALVPQGVSERAIVLFDPGLEAGDEQGMENVTSQDVKLAFLAIAQKTSKAVDPSEGKYIDGLKFGEMYNSESREIYGTGPIEFLPVMMGKRAHLKKENGTLGERVDWDDPRVTWEGAREAKRDKPEGVRIYDWACVLVPTLERVVLSFQSTSFGAGQSLNTILDKHRTLARVAGKGFRPFQLKLAVSTFIDKNDFGSFGKFTIELTGGPTPEQFKFASGWFESIKGKTIVVADAAEEEHAQPSNVVDGEVTKDPIPF